MIASDLIRAVLVLLLVFASNIWQIYAIFLALSTVSSFFVPAQSVTIPAIVPREGLIAASGLMQQSIQLVRIFAPAISGALVTSVGEASCYYLDSASFLFSGLMIASIVVAIERPPAARGMGRVVHELWEGIRFVLTHPKFSFVILSMSAGLFALSAFSALIAVYVRDILHAEAALFGAIGSMIGAGAITGGMAVTKLAKGRSQDHLVSLGMLGNGIFILILALIPRREVTLACSFGIGISVSLIIIAATAVLQGEAPPEMRGRVSSSSMSLMTMAQCIALVFAGTLAARIGIVNLFLASSAMLFVVALAGLWWLRRAA